MSKPILNITFSSFTLNTKQLTKHFKGKFSTPTYKNKLTALYHQQNIIHVHKGYVLTSGTKNTFKHKNQSKGNNLFNCIID